jgi:putative hydrolase of the HAD superfamily
MSEEFDAILFDAGGTLFDLQPTREEVFQRLFSSHGFDVPMEKLTAVLSKAERRFDDHAAKLNGVSEEPFWKQYDKYVLDGVGYTGDLESFSKEVSSEFDKLIPDVKSWAEYPDARPLLDDLVDRKFGLGVVSNATDLVRRVLDNLGLTRYFQSIVVSEEVGVRKPDPRIFHIAAKEIRTAPNRAIYIGDRLAIDVIGAKRAGMNAILLDRYGAYADFSNCLKVKSLSALRRYL